MGKSSQHRKKHEINWDPLGSFPPSVPVPEAFHQGKGFVEGLAEAPEHLNSRALTMLRQPGGGDLGEFFFDVVKIRP